MCLHKCHTEHSSNVDLIDANKDYRSSASMRVLIMNMEGWNSYGNGMVVWGVK